MPGRWRDEQEQKNWEVALARIEAARSWATGLDLSNLELPELPETLAQLSHLWELHLEGNQLAALPPWICKFTRLGYLHLSGNRIARLPDSMGELSQLRYLALGRNQLVATPPSIASLPGLTYLGLEDNQIAAIDESLCRAPNLRVLYLPRNRLTGVPDALGEMHALRVLDLSDNEITSLPVSLLNLKNLKYLFLKGNPGLGIPDEILGPPAHHSKPPASPRDILNYYIAKCDDSRPLNEAKLILVGAGGVGKTSLVKTLITGKFNSREKTTEGIKISDWQCPLSRNEKITLHIWDFGGQEMMHATHQFFLTARSVYLLVLNRRNGGYDKEADYWFRLIRAFGGKDVPVIVVLNKQQSEPFDVNRGGWLERYKENIRAFAETDCSDPKSITRLKQRIQEQLAQLKNVKAGFPRRWFAIKDELANLGTDYVTFDMYREICRKHGEHDPEKQTLLAGFLHDLGIALNYKDDPRLRFAYVLKPEWVTGGIYALLHAFVASKGLFTRDEAEQVLAKKNYLPAGAHFILGLMEQFELSFPLGDAQKRILIPQLLADQQPELDFNLSACLNFGYKYPIVPEGLLPRFIVRTHHLSDAATRWKSGVVLRHESSGCRALVRTDVAENQVRIHIDGSEDSRRELLAIIRHNFDAIHADYEFHPEELVYPPGNAEKSLVLDELKAILSSGNATWSVVLPNKTVRTLSIADLIEPVKSAPLPLRLFLSYSHVDEKYLDELRKSLKVMERNGLLRTWYDRELIAGERWEPRILQELNEADVVVCQLSPDFLASDFCMLTEVQATLERQERGEAVLIGYILKPCLWRDVKEFSQFQILPKDLKPLGRDRPKYWLEVAEGIKTALEKLQRDRAARPDPLARFAER